ncbi:MAG: NAD(P)-binding protein, partial [Rhodospirillaceae bacterium]|nr:NAD(P)-binding protein [Rhodospirillaceae bacterium]
MNDAAHPDAPDLGASGIEAPDLDTLIVGAGFAGLYLLHRLRGAGFRARVYEAGGGVGGTWYWNRYPGARCDVESMSYSYQFDEALQQDWEWT